MLLAGCMLLTQPSSAADAVKGNLVGVDWLQQNLSRSDLLLLDASFPQLYKAQHIPGAINVNVFSYGGQQLPVAQMQQLFQSFGVSPGKKIVIYDQGGTFMATKLFYDLYYHGFPAKDLLVLDGGLSKWQAAGGAVTKEPTAAPQKGSFRITTINEYARVRLPEFLTASGDPANNALVEALDASWHFGETAFFDGAGHIPYGIMLPSDEFFNADKTFKSADEIKRMLTYLGVRPQQQVLTYCGGGIAASVPFFALKFILDYPSVRLFQESVLGWVKDDRGLPFWTYDAPFLMRETNWLKTWGGKVMRSYGVSNISMIDVRPANVFAQGHMPFALNMSGDVFRSNIKNPEKLAELLGKFGINGSHEAVLISDAGLDPDSALGFLMLQSLGHKRVSVYVDSIDKWLELGQALTKDATATVSPTPYRAEVRNNALITDAKSTQGLYPKVFIASGKNLPGKTPDGKVVHVPYTELLDANGKPKAAKEIWKILVKAGVPRYAELVSFSDDPGEAAANYFILKLMGYPDVKVLMM